MFSNIAGVFNSVTFEQYTNLYLFITLLFLSTISGLWFLLHWFKNRAFKSRLYVGLGLLVSHLFLYPFIIVSLGNRIVTSDFNSFYGITIPIAFFGWLLIYAGILRISPIKYSSIKSIFLILWLGASVVIYLYLGLTMPGISIDRIFQILPLALFFIPIQLFGIHTSHKWFHVHEMKKREGFWARVHVASLLIVFILSFFQIGLASTCLVVYPPSFWFFALFSCSSVFVIEVVKVILLVVSFSVLMKAYEDKSNTVYLKY